MLRRAYGTSTVGFPAAMAKSVQWENTDTWDRIHQLLTLGLSATIAFFSYHAPGQPYCKCQNILQHNLLLQLSGRLIQRSPVGFGTISPSSGGTSEVCEALLSSLCPLAEPEDSRRSQTHHSLASLFRKKSMENKTDPRHFWCPHDAAVWGHLSHISSPSEAGQREKHVIFPLNPPVLKWNNVWI